MVPAFQKEMDAKDAKEATMDVSLPNLNTTLMLLNPSHDTLRSVIGLCRATISHEKGKMFDVPEKVCTGDTSLI